MKRFITVLSIALIVVNCSNVNSNKGINEELIALRTELDSLKTLNSEVLRHKENQIATFLTFQDNNAENAMNFYVDLFKNSTIINVQRWTKEGPGDEGRIMTAKFELNGNLYMCSDSPPVHNWDFTPAVSNYVECKNLSELERLFSKLSENGSVTMPLNNYGFSQQFAWVIDQFGVSWQLNLK